MFASGVSAEAHFKPIRGSDSYEAGLIPSMPRLSLDRVFAKMCESCPCPRLHGRQSLVEDRGPAEMRLGACGGVHYIHITYVCMFVGCGGRGCVPNGLFLPMMLSACRHLQVYS